MKELGKDVIKALAKAILDKNLEELAEAQGRLWADDRYAVLVVLQAMDAAGKDGTIKHVMSGVNHWRAGSEVPRGDGGAAQGPGKGLSTTRPRVARGGMHGFAGSYPIAYQARLLHWEGDKCPGV
jgi:Polyphosphate kinase 2 (PPK2)